MSTYDPTDIDRQLQDDAERKARKQLDRDAEAEGLSGAGLCLADGVVALECNGECQGLDREGMNDALVGKCAGDGFGDSEIRERFLIEILTLAGDISLDLIDFGHGCCR